ncbi:hypothetical protein CVT25_003932 [Psilocybe cyanescens]|uniref:Uncharacterized protein n=1 Tax=Psilocybe cyanescens TaxID=93625 RepID=A0A409XW34_PSICY|nr:hypothetical protein CVT25_003932 [Psilocybe cyanescens]
MRRLILIVSALERRFPPSSGYQTLFPLTKDGTNAGTGLIKAFSKFYAENTLFPPVTNLLPWDKVPAAFLKDRSEFAGSPINAKALAANVPVAQSVISSHLLLIEEQLSDSRQWLFYTETPSLADVSVHFVFNWARSFKGTGQLFDSARIPFTIQWLDRLSSEIKNKRKSQSPPTKLSGLDAANKIVSANYEPYNVVGFDITEASRLRVSLGDMVRVAPEDTARNFPTSGKLVALNREEMTLEIKGSQGLIRCHFPRLGFSIKRTSGNKLNDTSPCSRKIDHVLALKNILHEKVDISSLLPRPEITDQLGIIYRRIPVLPIGNDGLVQYELIVNLLPWDAFPAVFAASSYQDRVSKHEPCDIVGFDTIEASHLRVALGDTVQVTPEDYSNSWPKIYYDASPYSRKIDSVLTLKRIPHERVNVSPMLPRPEITDQLGITYRRIPILSIGNDVYCDTSESSRLVEEEEDSVERHREKLLIEEQLSDSREWLFNTASPSLADISLHFSFAWTRAAGFKTVEALFDPARIPFTIKWFDRLAQAIETEKQNKSSPKTLDGAEAAAKIVSASHESYDVVGFDAIEASRLGTALEDAVQVVPEDTGRNHPTVGKLVALNREEVILEVRGTQGLVRCHFPRIGFLISKVPLNTTQ